MKKIKEFFQKETVLCVALILAIASSFLVTPDRKYLEYIDFRTLAILFCLMAVMAGLQKIGVFRFVAEMLLGKVRRESQPVLILVMLCFFFSMLITNDVALITFVPFTITVLDLMGEKQKKALLIPLVVMQTIAANLGSMLTPVGNPQNLYLYGKAGLSPGEFVALMLPYTLLALVMCLLWCAAGMLKARGGDGRNDSLQITFDCRTSLKGKKGYMAVYLLLFGLALLVVAHVIPYEVTLVITILVILIMDRGVLANVDYSLLFTFVGFFIFIGNMGRIPAFSAFLQKVVEGNEVLTSVVASQAISNVPAALLLSGFTGNYEALIVGTNLGGLGTLIASMASLISYKFVAKEEGCEQGKYLLYFTVANICFLVPLVLLYIIM